MAHRFLGITLLTLVSGTFLSAGEPSVNDAATFPMQGDSRWSLGAGMVFRPISGDFTMHAPPPLRLSLPRSASGSGDAGLFSGGTSTIRYDQGSVGPDLSVALNAAGNTGFAEASGAQVGSTSRPDGAGGVIPEYLYTSSSSSSSSFSRYAAQSARSTDEDTGMGAQIELRYEALRLGPADISLGLSYAWITAALHSGEAALARQTSFRTTAVEEHRYAYDYVTGLDAVLYDSATALAFGGPAPAGSDYRDPRQSHESSSSTQLIESYTATASTRLDLDLHEILFSAQASVSPTRWLHLGVAIGPTLNVLDAELETHGAWRNRSGRKVATFHDKLERSITKLGVACDLALRVDLSRSVYLQAATGYHYVPEVQVRNALAEAEVDASSWKTTVGLGWRF